MDRREQLRRHWYDSGYESLGINFAQVAHKRRKAVQRRIDWTNIIGTLIFVAWIVALIVW